MKLLFEEMQPKARRSKGASEVRRKEVHSWGWSVVLLSRGAKCKLVCFGENIYRQAKGLLWVSLM
jgi:hypothetical protein